MWYCVSKYQIIFYLLKLDCCIGPKTDSFYLSLGISDLCADKGTSSIVLSWILTSLDEWLNKILPFWYFGSATYHLITVLKKRVVPYFLYTFK